MAKSAALSATQSAPERRNALRFSALLCSALLADMAIALMLRRQNAGA